MEAGTASERAAHAKSQMRVMAMGRHDLYCVLAVTTFTVIGWGFSAFSLLKRLECVQSSLLFSLCPARSALGRV